MSLKLQRTESIRSYSFCSTKATSRYRSTPNPCIPGGSKNNKALLFLFWATSCCGQVPFPFSPQTPKHNFTFIARRNRRGRSIELGAEPKWMGGRCNQERSPLHHREGPFQIPEVNLTYWTPETKEKKEKDRVSGFIHCFSATLKA